MTLWPLLSSARSRVQTGGSPLPWDGNKAAPRAGLGARHQEPAPGDTRAFPSGQEGLQGADRPLSLEPLRQQAPAHAPFRATLHRAISPPPGGRRPGHPWLSLRSGCPVASEPKGWPTARSPGLATGLSTANRCRQWPPAHRPAAHLLVALWAQFGGHRHCLGWTPAAALAAWAPPLHLTGPASVRRVPLPRLRRCLFYNF